MEASTILIFDIIISFEHRFLTILLRTRHGNYTFLYAQAQPN
jgi:hypothetical protein